MNTDEDALRRILREELAAATVAAVLVEREACAELADCCSGGDSDTPARAVIAARIRARR